MTPKLTLLHNPHCSTSVHALQALEDTGHAESVRRYLLVAERAMIGRPRSRTAAWAERAASPAAE